MCWLILQYPQTGRTSGNSRRSTSMTLSYVLAVPSDGSNLRQLTTTAWYHIACTSCSTLRRVEPHATSCYSPTIRLLSVLQYPQTGRTSCNADANLALAQAVVLQYPQTGRT